MALAACFYPPETWGELVGQLDGCVADVMALRSEASGWVRSILPEHPVPPFSP